MTIFAEKYKQSINIKKEALEQKTHIEKLTVDIESLNNNSTGETIGDVVQLMTDNAKEMFNLGKSELTDTLFNDLAMPILETAGVDKDLLNYVLTFLKDPSVNKAELVAKLDKLNLEEAARMAQVFGESGGKEAYMLSQALAKTALFTIYPGIGETIKGLNKTLGEIKEKIEMKFDSKGLVSGLQDKAKGLVSGLQDKAKGLVSGLQDKAAAVNDQTSVVDLQQKGGKTSKKINKTKVKRRIHNSIKKFYKTNNLKTLKREIQRMKKRFTRGNK
jgi:hypothetical protein